MIALIATQKLSCRSQLTLTPRLTPTAIIRRVLQLNSTAFLSHQIGTRYRWANLAFQPPNRKPDRGMTQPINITILISYNPSNQRSITPSSLLGSQKLREGSSGWQLGYQQLQKKGGIMVEDYFQLKSEWQRVGETLGAVFFHHRYSRETAEQRLLVAAPMRELEHFTVRQAYSFPACPRVYKCATLANYCTGNALHVDLALLVESLSCSLASASGAQKKQAVRKLEKQLGQLVGGFQYLCRRYGPFIISQDLIFWNSYGMARVWLSSNTLQNHPQRPVENEEKMITSLSQLLQRSLELRFREKIKSFEELTRIIERGQYDRIDGAKRVKFERVEEERNSQLSDIRNRLLSVPKVINHAYSNVSIESRPSGKQLAASFQFDVRRKTRLRSRLSSQKESRGDQSLAEDKSCGRKGLQTQRQMEDQVQSGKENAEPPLRRKQSKTQTCMLGTHTLSHPRRYSKPTNPSYTQEYFPGRRKSSLLREELLSQFDGLFRSGSEVSFDSSELQKELQGVL